MIRKQGKGAWLWKIDLVSAYRQISIHPTDTIYLWFQWAGKFWADYRLPFGVRSAPAIFTVFIAAFLWILCTCFAHIFLYKILHYLDDSFGAHPSQAEATQAMSTFREQANRFGWKINEKKVYGPSQSLSILGMLYDTNKQVVTIDTERRTKLIQEIKELSTLKSCQAKRIESLVGKLTFVSQTITGGLCHIYPLRDAILNKEPFHHINLFNKNIKDTFDWWTNALTQFGDLSFDFICNPTITPHIIYTDAATTTGAGGWFYNMYFQYEWPNKN